MNITNMNEYVLREHEENEYIYWLSLGGWEGDESINIHESELVLEAEKESPEVLEKKRLAAANLGPLFKTYGNSTQEPPSEKELKHRIGKRFDELSAMTPEERRQEYRDAAARRESAHISKNVLSSNTKQETIGKIPSKNKDRPNGHISVGMSFTPDRARHYTDADGHFKERNSCICSTEACRASCLAKHGNYEFASGQGLRDKYTQSLTHNEKSTADHATRLYQELEAKTKSAKKEGKSLLARMSVTDDSAHHIHVDAIKKHFPEVEHSGYTKRLDGDTEGLHFSDPGSRVRVDEKTGKKVPVPENIRRASIVKKAQSEYGKPSYLVFNRRRPKADSAAGDKDYDFYHKTMNELHTVRRYENDPSEPAHGEKAEYHHPDGYGRVIASDGKSYRYQDHGVAKKTKNVDGEEKFATDHDARYVDEPNKVTKTNPHEGPQKKVGFVTPAFATRSSSNKNLNSSGFFHDVKNIKDGVYHEGHPNEMLEAKRNVKPSYQPINFTKKSAS